MPALLQVDFPFEGPFGDAMAEGMKGLAESIAAEPGLIWKVRLTPACFALELSQLVAPFCLCWTSQRVDDVWLAASGRLLPAGCTRKAGQRRGRRVCWTPGICCLLLCSHDSERPCHHARLLRCGPRMRRPRRRAASTCLTAGRMRKSTSPCTRCAAWACSGPDGCMLAGGMAFGRHGICSCRRHGAVAQRYRCTGSLFIQCC